MPAPVLTSADIDLVFSFARSDALPYRDAGGDVVTAPADAPRFDHDEGGQPLGLLVTPGYELGGGERLAVDPMMLPEALLPGPDVPTPGTARDATVLHRFRPPGGDETRRAYYTRDVRAAIDRLMAQAGHHAEIGVVAGFLPNRGGWVRYRGAAWQTPGVMATGGGALLAAEAGKPLVSSGAIGAPVTPA